MTLRAARAEFTRQYLLGQLYMRGSVLRAAQASGVTRQNFYALMNRYGIRKGWR